MAAKKSKTVKTPETAKEHIIDMLTKMSGKYSAYEIFSDWIRCCALTISNSCQLIHNKVWKDREQSYIDTMRKYTHEEQMIFCEMLAYLTDALEEDISDVLGEVLMKSNMGSKDAGQFFTPFHVSKLTAKMALPAEPDADGKIKLNEPSCGGGGMIIAAAAILHEKGINYQQVLEVVAQDLDWRGVYMTYIQLSLLGIKAICVQGDTLNEPYIAGKTSQAHILYTPAWRGMLI